MFDRFARAHQPASPRRHLLLILSLVCHALAVIGLVIYSFVYVQELPEPILSLTLLRIPPVPVMLGLGPRTESRPRPRPRLAQRTPPSEVRPHLQQPTPQPRAETPPATSTTTPSTSLGDSDPDGDPDGDPNGDPDGDPNGGPGGGDPNGDPNGTGLGGQPPEPTHHPAAVRNVAHDLDPSQILYHPEPHLPDPVKARYRTSGEALFIAKVCIDRSGRVFRTDVIQGIEGADQAILATIQAWRYRQQPIPVCFAARWIFSIAP